MDSKLNRFTIYQKSTIMKLKPNLNGIWVFCLIILASSCSLLDKENETPESTQQLTSIEIGSTFEVATATIPTSGGIIKVVQTGTPLDDLEISIPASAFPANQTFKVSYSEIVSHKLGKYFNPISPLISITYDGGYSASPMQITIPIKLPEGHFAMAFYLDETTGKLEGLPVLKLSSNSITVNTRHFMSGSGLSGESSSLKSASALPKSMANMIVSSFAESELAKQTIINSGFSVGKDDWEFINFGSYLAPGGHCAGQSMTSMWYYYEKKLNAGANLFHRFDQLNVQTNPSFIWQDNPLGYRFASTIQQDFNFDGWITGLNLQSYIPGIVFKSFAAAILVTGEPQFVLINNSAGQGGHAMIVYKVNFNEGKLYIADPNYPNNRESKNGNESVRTIDYVGGILKPYETGLTAGANSTTMDQIGYFGKTAFIDWKQIGKRWDELANNTIGTIAPNTFPAYTLWVKDGAGYELKDGVLMTKDTLRINAICPTAEIFYKILNQKLVGLTVFDEKGLIVSKGKEHTPTAVLKPGANKLGIYIYGWRDKHKYDNGNDIPLFIDFKWLTINYIPLTIDPNPLQGLPNIDHKLTARSKGTAPKSSKYIWDFGDGTSKVTVLNDSVASHSFSKVGIFNVKVELYDNSSGKKITEAVSVAEISNNVVSSKSFSFNWTQKSIYTGGFTVNYGISGTVDGLNGNKVLDISRNKYINTNVEIEFSDYGAFRINFNGSFSVSPSKRDTTYTDGTSQTVSYNGKSGMKWMTQSFTPYTFSATSSGTFENSNSFGDIDIWGYFEEKIENFDKDKKLIDSKTEMVTFPMMLLEFDKQ
jgi:hypothetical protein